MTARKSTRKTAGKSSGAAKRTTKKASTARKAPAAKRAAATKRPAARKAAARKAAAKKPSEAAAEKSPEPKGRAGKPAKQGISSTAVNLGNVIALRPRVSTSFRQEDFLKARRLLDEESYKSLEEAARAVAERALALSNDPKGKRGPQRGR